eukprot:6196095-Pleurochrysis_carterae.AAC.3
MRSGTTSSHTCELFLPLPRVCADAAARLVLRPSLAAARSPSSDGVMRASCAAWRRRRPVPAYQRGKAARGPVCEGGRATLC